MLPELRAKSHEELQLILKELVDQVQPLFGNKLKKIILFGSYARGDYDAESDIDLMLMINDSEENFRKFSKRITDIVVELNLKYDIVLAIILQNEKVFLKYQHVMPFYFNVNNEGVIVYEQ
ncbi:MAG TPA: nucleotidyltransferase domain-containing protein [Bacillota bacterium]|nr:nucleotidyltransferase domain-containing protein [Bacillota bacterium]